MALCLKSCGLKSQVDYIVYNHRRQKMTKILNKIGNDVRWAILLMGIMIADAALAYFGW